ncbi:MAG: DNA repair protein RecN [Leptospiraceae bacterium]|nr:DNA repair protein RecN [Leptospiraceae bacterium]
MLESLQIENFGIVEAQAFRPGQGLNVVTGETGSGKSLLLQAISVVLGHKSSPEMIRHGSRLARLRGVFDISGRKAIQEWLEAHGLPAREPYLQLEREISFQGRPRPQINGERVTLGLYRELGQQLVEIHGQHENQLILNPDVHMEYLDRFAGTLELRDEVSVLFRQYHRLQGKIRSVSLEANEREERRDYLHHAIEEIEGFAIRPGEYDELLQERQLIMHSGQLYKDLEQSYDFLRSHEHSIQDQLDEVQNALQKHIDILPELEEIIRDIQEAYYLAEASADQVRSHRERLSFTPDRLEQVEERLNGYRRLFKKYAPDEEGLLQKNEEYLQELGSIEMSAEQLELLKAEVQIIHSDICDKAEQLSRYRRGVVKELEQQIAQELHQLGMPGARIEISIQHWNASSANPDQNGILNDRRNLIQESGLDNVEFLLAANQGEGIAPLRKVASGGELSRISLALKTIFFAASQCGLIIFDEIDAGVSGAIAHTIANRLKRLATRTQVLVVTHLHQIACEAEYHFAIQKQVKADRTHSILQTLASEERLVEMARMMGGSKDDDLAMNHARSLLQHSGQKQGQARERSKNNAAASQNPIDPQQPTQKVSVAKVAS